MQWRRSATKTIDLESRENLAWIRLQRPDLYRQLLARYPDTLEQQCIRLRTEWYTGRVSIDINPDPETESALRGLSTLVPGAVEKLQRKFPDLDSCGVAVDLCQVSAVDYKVMVRVKSAKETEVRMMEFGPFGFGRSTGSFIPSSGRISCSAPAACALETRMEAVIQWGRECPAIHWDRARPVEWDQIKRWEEPNRPQPSSPFLSSAPLLSPSSVLERETKCDNNSPFDATNLFRPFVPPLMLPDLVGDLDESFQRNARAHGASYAKKAYLREVLKSWWGAVVKPRMVLAVLSVLGRIR